MWSAPLVVTHTFGANQVQTYMGNGTEPFGKDSQSYKPAAATAGSETMTRNFSPNDNNDDLAVVAVKQASTSMQVASSTPYRQSFTYDWLGNVLSITRLWTDCRQLRRSGFPNQFCGNS